MKIRCNNTACKSNYTGRIGVGSERERLCKAENPWFTRDESSGWTHGMICQSWERKENENDSSA